MSTNFDTIWFTSGSNPLHFSTNSKVCVYTELIVLCAHAPWSLARSSCFPVISQSLKSFVSTILLSSDNAVRSKRFRHSFVIFESNFGLKNVYISSGPWSIAAKQRGMLWADVSVICLRFSHGSLQQRAVFWWPFAFQILPTRFKNNRISRLHWAFKPLFGMKYPIGTIRIFFYPDINLDIFLSG